MYGTRNRPWSPAGHDNLGSSGRNIDRYLAHTSHGWGTPTREQQVGWDDEQEATFRRHRANLRTAYEPEYDDDAAYHYSVNRRNRREASDVSVEALDLADYAHTLRRADAARNDPYPYPPSNNNNNRPFSREPWSPTASPPAREPQPPGRIWSPPSLPFPPTATMPIDRPFSALSRDTMMAPPSLVSADTTSHSSHTHTSPLIHPVRRPFSLPADYIAPRGPAIFNAGTPPPSARGVGTGRRVPLDTAEMDYGMPNPDVASFPPWARKWYAQEDATAKFATKGKRPEFPRSPVEDEIFGPYIHPAASQQDLGLLPWNPGQGNDDQAPSGAIPDNVKEERMRMLEREFGDKGTKRGWKEAAGGDGVIGGVDEKGNLITGGRKKRIAVRVVQAIFAILTAASGIYGALFIKLKTPAPPSGHVAAYILYALSVITILLMFFFFVVSPLCLHRNKGPDSDMANPGGMMVLPVNAGNQTGKKKKKGKGGKDDPGSVQVNLIVDPNMFGTGTGRGRGMPGRYDDDDDDEYYSDDGTNPSSRRKGRRRPRDWDDEEHAPPRRRSIFTGLAMERAWKRARSQLKKRVALDIILTIGWTASFVMILLGSRCPPGTLDGWCDAYNIATAGASTLIVLFATSAFFGIKDLNRSKASPRTRT